MGFNEFIGKLFGNKQTRDIKEIQPWVEKIKAAYPKYEKVSNDELRAATQAIKQKIKDFVIPERTRLEELKAKVEKTELEDREPLFNQIDKLEKEIMDRYEVVLDDVLPDPPPVNPDRLIEFLHVHPPKTRTILRKQSVLYGNWPSKSIVNLTNIPALSVFPTYHSTKNLSRKLLTFFDLRV